LPYAFYISNEELVVQLGVYLQKNKGLQQVYIQMFLFNTISILTG